MSKTQSTLNVDGTEVHVSNLDKSLYKKAGFTKGQVIDYYIKISEVLLPHLKDRALTLKRYPDGVEGFFFYEKQCPSHRPRWVKTTQVPKEEGKVNYCVINDLPSLVWAANLADLELHTFLHKKNAPERPTSIAFDLDPGEGVDIISCTKVAMHIQALFKELKLKCYPKTSGSKGMQLHVPLNTAVTYERTKAFAHQLAQALEVQLGDKVVSNMQKKLRKNKVFIDWSQNDDHKTTICVYSLRAKSTPAVSTPLTWKEVAQAAKKEDASLLHFEHDDVLARIQKHGDLYADVLNIKQKLPSLKTLDAALETINVT